MITIDSTIEGVQSTFGEISDLLNPEGFHIGSGYTYEHGYFDKPLDWEEEHGYRYYLRIPAFAVKGEIGHPKATIRLGKPFIIKHEFLTTNDHRGDIGIASALVNQFTEPLPTEDAEIDEKWISRGTSTVQLVEKKISHLK
ncbi:YugN family protein [Paenactinomyces guangxiensis]|uniref:YugN-like family protein n=1 Tax=Paenactinomyces guangxiensis TaxID=1490290 RepID=A0A7W2A7E6_9BACL|nr:YugN family protein [Paenactinomyces guangxiensis]MBA4492708.1 hypothetical protein [Paenactinomyces guangxiensis]MBH8590444.1 hypothetical protein [Paenactinomyces guangxiensis]